ARTDDAWEMTCLRGETIRRKGRRIMVEENILRRRMLIADDEGANVLLLEKILRRAGFHNLRTTTDSQVVQALYAEFQPDALLLDLHMPGLTGCEVMAPLRRVVHPGQS